MSRLLSNQTFAPENFLASFPENQYVLNFENQMRKIQYAWLQDAFACTHEDPTFDGSQDVFACAHEDPTLDGSQDAFACAHEDPTFGGL
jgi:hypothetical protein